MPEEFANTEIVIENGKTIELDNIKEEIEERDPHAYYMILIFVFCVILIFLLFM